MYDLRKNIPPLMKKYTPNEKTNKKVYTPKEKSIPLYPNKKVYTPNEKRIP